MSEANKKFLVYLTSYLGVALIGGSIVHVGTLDAHSTRYIVLGVVGLVLMIVGNVLEAKMQKEPLNLKYFGIVSALAVATGFLSGGIQHYLDNPIYAGYLLAIGLILAYIAFTQKYHLSTTSVGLMAVIALGLVIVTVSNTILHDVKSHEVGGEHTH
jgi:hypothetical protein